MTTTHTHLKFANPYLRCDTCEEYVPAWHDGDKCGCDQGWWNAPCGHTAGIHSICPSWSPADGCMCKEHLGRVAHQLRTA